MKIWLIGDTHFNHKKLLQYENRPKDFNRIIIQNWNKVVSTDDIVIHLGDVILGQDSTLKEILGNCLGRKILTRGNHDHHSMQWYMQRGFDFACDYFVYKNIAFSHAPLTPLPFRTSDENYNKQVSLNIHAHFHHGNHRGKPGMKCAW